MPALIRPRAHRPGKAISRLDLGLALIATDCADAAVDETRRALGSERITSTVLARARDVDVGLQRAYPGLATTKDVHDRCRALAASQMQHLQLTPS